MAKCASSLCKNGGALVAYQYGVTDTSSSAFLRSNHLSYGSCEGKRVIVEYETTKLCYETDDTYHIRVSLNV